MEPRPRRPARDQCRAAVRAEPPFVPRQSEASRFEAHLVDQTALRAHELLHQQSTADPEGRHRLARLDHVHRRLLAAAALLRGGGSADGSRRSVRVFAFVAGPVGVLGVASIPRPWWQIPLIVGVGFVVNIAASVMFSRACPHGTASPWGEPRLLAAVEEHLVEVGRLSGEVAARAAAELAAARELLRNS